MKAVISVYSRLLDQIVKVTLLFVVAIILTGCETVEPVPEVVETAEAAESVSPINLEMIRALSELNDLKEELKLLRNSIEELQFQQENADRSQQDLFQDVDRRLLALEDAEQQRKDRIAEELASSQKALTPSQQILAEGQVGGSTLILNQSDSIPDLNQSEQTSSSNDNNGTQINVVKVGGNDSQLKQVIKPSETVTIEEQDAYDAAFELLKQSRYQDAIVAFQTMVNTWPSSQLADDALYWMSEANYVNREFEAALNGFRTIVESYPTSTRLPEAMLKVGYIQYDIGAYDAAAETFQDILTRFPGHQVTVSADTRLRRIKQTIQ